MFSEEIEKLSWEETTRSIYAKTEADVRRALNKEHCTVDDFMALISPAAAPYLEEMALLSKRYTEERFGRTMSLFIPLYLTNSCANSCVYCGFHISNPMPRTILTFEEIENEYRRIFTAELEREKIVGKTLFGVHRDDLSIDINGNPARLFASQGQQRSIVLSLKLAEGEVNKEICGEYPVFLFDDVLSELDERRRKYVLEGIGEKQIIITSCEKDTDIRENGRKIEVSGGIYEERE